MPMPLPCVPGVLDCRAWSEIRHSVVQPVSVDVIYDSVPLELHPIHIRHNLMQGDATALHISMLGQSPLRPGKLVPNINIHKEIVEIVQWFDNGQVPYDVELVFRAKLPDLLIILAEMLYEWKVHMDNYTTSHIEQFKDVMMIGVVHAEQLNGLLV